MTRRLLALPLAAWERDGLKAALVKAGLPADDVGDPRLLFWRFESHEDVPVGFGGLAVHGDDALLHSVVTLPPLRELGMGAAIVAALEDEARAHRCRAIYLRTERERDFFAGLGYAPCAQATCRRRCAAADNSTRPPRRASWSSRSVRAG
jgi:N-acetylglutamate synthase-like GNAT family acetyltransferase